MSLARPDTGWSPVQIAAGYAVFGVLWIATTDQLILWLTDDSGRATALQTIKGWVFVFLSTALVFGLVRRGQRNLQATNDRLDDALQQTSILDRILRHNLRNSCNVIQANARMLEDDVSPEMQGCLETIESHNERLIELSGKSRELRDIVLAESDSAHEMDLVVQVEDLVDTLELAYPDADVETELPESLSIQADSRLGRAIYELLDNALEHNPGSEPKVIITVEKADPDHARLVIADDGPGLPAIERKVLQQGVETQMAHSQGLGLWIARTLVTRLDGEFSIRDRNPQGTVVELTVPRQAGGLD